MISQLPPVQYLEISPGGSILPEFKSYVIFPDSYEDVSHFYLTLLDILILGLSLYFARNELQEVRARRIHPWLPHPSRRTHTRLPHTHHAAHIPHIPHLTPVPPAPSTGASSAGTTTCAGGGTWSPCATTARTRGTLSSSASSAPTQSSSSPGSACLWTLSETSACVHRPTLSVAGLALTPTHPTRTVSAERLRRVRGAGVLERDRVFLRRIAYPAPRTPPAKPLHRWAPSLSLPRRLSPPPYLRSSSSSSSSSLRRCLGA